jgi:hypothetical protein
VSHRRKENKNPGETDVQYVDKQRGIAVVLEGDEDLKGQKLLQRNEIEWPPD